MLPIRSLFCCLLLLLPHLSAATNVNVKVNITASPCKINDGQNVDVDFGDVGINKVDGANYRKELPYTLSCEAGSDGIALILQGTPVSFDSAGATVESTVTGLGIKFRLGASDFKLNTPMPVSLSALPILTAVPFKNPTVQLSEGDFDATATLIAVYQ